MMIRAVRNNNPGNIVAGDHWQGLMPRAKMTPEQAAEDHFAVFESPAWGFRALAILLQTYGKRYGLTTVRGIIGRFAPPDENDTEAYIAAAAKSSGHSPDAPLDLHDVVTLSGLCRAIAIYEAGLWCYQDSDLAEGVAMAVRS